MEFLKSAVASAISKGPAFGFTLGDRVDLSDSIWTLHNGTKKDDGSKCSVFAFDINANKSRLPLAKNALRKWRTLRHPGVVRVLDTLETDTNIYVATERVVPLGWHVKRNALNTETIKWGLYTISSTMKFVNEDASSIHGNLRVSSIYTTESGEWKLAGFEVLSSLKEEDPAIFTYGGLLPDSSRYAAPEIGRGGWDGLKNQAVHVTDSWNMGTLIYEIFNGYATQDQLSQIKSIPAPIAAPYRRLTQANPKLRLPISHFLEQGKRAGSFFDTPLIRCCEFIENMGVKDEREREEFLQNLEETKDQFPEEFFKAKVLPELLKSVEYGGGGPKVFSVVLMIADKLSEDEWESTITPCIVRLFSSPDRAIRVFLLDNLPKMIDHLPGKIVSGSIFPQLVTGFSDVAPIVREQTVKSILIVINKLSDRQINGDLLKYLAKTQNDEQPGIRTNTTICLGKIAKNLGQHTRAKVLAAAFTRSLRDPFVHARNAALMALAATADVFDETDCATKCLPAICPTLIDKEKIIRTQAQKTFDVYMARIKTLTANMPDTALPPPNSADANGVAGGAAAPRMGTPQTDASWAGWAISSFTKTLSSVTGEMQTQPQPPSSGVSTPTQENGSNTLGLPSTASSSRPGSSRSASTTSNLHRQAVSSSSPNSTIRSKSGNLQIDDDDDDADYDAWGAMGDETPAEKPKFGSTGGGGGGFGKTSAANEDDMINSLLNKPKSALPKGLGKKTAGTTTTATAKSTAAANRARIGKKPVIAGRAVAPPKKKEPPPPAADVDADAAWGNDNWDADWK
ncbi:hypothetical protein Dda_0484 [Drechslerella dactyloides]|uniref:Protein kinase domain-containing protein n=1 Tax=Drechslerella dactyloides TaxID=74499 RepID=A0AAD6NMP6_DREDA|nr:hypothetical protein Dda_0484 [Drechslerella dactyloides]